MLTVLLFITITTITPDTDTLFNIQNVHIYNQVGDVKVIQSSTPFLNIEKHSGNTSQDIFEVKKRIKDNSLYIEIKPRKSCFQCSSNITIGIDSLHDLTLEVTSGNITIDNSAKKLDISVMSGDVFLKGRFNKAHVEILSGELKIQDAYLDTLNVSLSSGSINAHFGNIISYGNINVLSGDINIAPASGQRIEAISSTKPDTLKRDGSGYLHLKVTSGNIKFMDKR